MTEETQTERSWLKLSDGESMQFVIRDDQPQIHVLHWVGGVAEEHLEENCPWCKQGIRRAVRYTVPIESQDGSDAWEMASLTWKDLAAVGKATGGIKGQTIALSRRGVGRATRYTIVPLGKRAPAGSPVTTDIAPAVQAALGKQAPSSSPMPTEAAPTGYQPHIPSDTADAISLEEEMKNIAADPAGAAAYIKGLCAGLEITTEHAFKMFHNDNPNVQKDASPVRIFAGMIPMLEGAAEQKQAEPKPELDIALADLLGFGAEETGELPK